MIAVPAYYDGTKDEYVDVEPKITAASASMQALHSLQKYRKQGKEPIDYREELTNILGERYESFN